MNGSLYERGVGRSTGHYPHIEAVVTCVQVTTGISVADAAHPPCAASGTLAASEPAGQLWRSIADMVAVISAALADSAVGLHAAVVLDHALAASLPAGGVVGVAARGMLMRYRTAAWARAINAQLNIDEQMSTEE